MWCVKFYVAYVGKKRCLVIYKLTRSAINNIPISTSECERGFSQMNLIVTPTRASLQLSTVANLMFIKLVGLPVSMFKPSVYVNSLFLKGDGHQKQEKESGRC